ncbi:ATP-dependent RNA helicase HrpA [Syntrophobacteraceae bacterium DRH4]|nr:ATP-dependent RNA helicase HrpA [Desulfoferrobacter suflitae]
MNSISSDNQDAGSSGDQTPPFILKYPPELPITEKREEVVRAIAAHQVLVITGETGSGKSTQIPKMCLEAGRGQGRKIGCTQPRRIAAVTLAKRIAEELGSDRSNWVGYKIRFQDRTSRATRIKLMTDGILLAEAQSDRLFRSYDTLIIDEAHERSLNIDFLLGMVQKIIPRRPDLKVIITSATIDPEKFSRAFNDAPIIEVSGRTYPVEVWYRPMESSEEAESDVTYIDQAVAVLDLLKKRRNEGARGDVLIFMPTESDIRETVQRLEEKRYFNTLVMPLFGRMAAADQQRIFRTTSEDKIIVATNVAETSITIPGIRYVIDSGLARISQYNARSRTQGLPIVRISRASADQRKGRCGRVRAGICIRLYSEDDYQARPLFTPPEIQRSNLAEVILRMLYLRLGNIKDFPFLDPPSPSAIKDGFAVLKELIAVDEHRKLTPMGRTMARLPLDPRLSRMLLQAKKEDSLAELTILTAALSIQDPRERPLELETQADQAHAGFRDRNSDFIALLKIWQGYEQRLYGEQADGGELFKDAAKAKGKGAKRAAESFAGRAGQAQMRKFCRENFLSYRRMREWRDIYQEVKEILKGLATTRMNRAPASYEAIHRALVSGYLSHIGLRKEKNIYLSAKNRQVMLFPGSGLFNKGGSWIVASELVQTSRLFARTVANIQPGWLEELGRHLCRCSYSEPHWEKKRGQVVAYEKVTLYGLPIVERRAVNFARINPVEARKIFIQSALVEGEIAGRYGFLEHNKQLIEKLEELENKMRRRELLVDDAVVYDFYDKRLPSPGRPTSGDPDVPVIADLRTFNKFIKQQDNDDFLRMQEADLLRSEPDFGALRDYPGRLKANDLELPLKYVFAPGEEHDGVTATVPIHALRSLQQKPLDWLVPGMLLEKITLLLKSLPKAYRRRLVPVAETAHQILGCLNYGQGDFYAELSRCLMEVKNVEVPHGHWSEDELPQHLRLRLEVIAPDGAVIAAGRELNELKGLSGIRFNDDLFEKACRLFEQSGSTGADLVELEARIELGTDACGITRFAYPGLVAENERAAVRLFKDPAAARAASYGGLKLLYQLNFQTELRQLKKDWTYPEEMALQLAFIGSTARANELLLDYLLNELFAIRQTHFTYGWPERRQFLENVAALKGKLAPLGRQMLAEVLAAVEERERARTSLQRFERMARGNAGILQRIQILTNELNMLVPSTFPRQYRRFEIQQLPRYLKALQIRAERAYAAPEKDRAKEEQLVPYLENFAELRKAVAQKPTQDDLEFLADFRWLLEEFRISLFAPEVKTRMRISGKRLEEKYREWLIWRGKSTTEQ